MYSKKSLYSIFKINQPCTCAPCDNPRFKRYVEGLTRSCMNDNQVIQLVFKVGEELGLSGLPTDLDFKYSPDLPPEVLNVLDALRGEVPGFEGFQSDEEAFSLIRSRYDQFGGEMDEYVHHLVDIINESQKQPEPSESPKTE